VSTRQPPASPGKSTPARHSVVVAVVRPLVTVAALIVLYFLLPVDRPLGVGTLVTLVVGVLVVVALIVWETRVILRSRHPTLQGVQALALIVPLFLLVFANVYFVLQNNQVASFSAPLTRTDALYFVVTVFATVGFGDIAPVSQAARILVTAQMIGDLLVLGIALRVILTAVERGRERAAGDPGVGR
jgi:voltage-gated potassium channel